MNRIGGGKGEEEGRGGGGEGGGGEVWEGGEEAENKPISRRGLGAGVGALYNSCNM